MRPPEWKPGADLERWTRAALAHWREEQPRRKRPAQWTEREELLVYAWRLRECTSEAQVKWVAIEVLRRTKGHFPDPAEVASCIAFGIERAASRRAYADAGAPKWSGREEDACPNCGHWPTYRIVATSVTSRTAPTTSVGVWVYDPPPCHCHGTHAHGMRSTWLMGIPAREEDNPRDLMEMYRAASESAHREALRTGVSLASLLAPIGRAMASGPTVAA